MRVVTFLFIAIAAGACTQEPPAEVVMARGKAAMRLTVLPSDQLLPLAGVELPRATRPEPPPSFTGRTVVVPPPGTPSAIVVPPPAPRVIVRERRRDDGGAGAFIGGFVTGLVFGALADDDDRRYHRHRRSHHVRHRSRPNRGVGRRR